MPKFAGGTDPVRPGGAPRFMYTLMGGETVEGTIDYAVSASDGMTRFEYKQSNGQTATVAPSDAARMAAQGASILMLSKIRGTIVRAMISRNRIVAIPDDGQRATCDALFGYETTGWSSAYGGGRGGQYGNGGYVGQIGSSYSSGPQQGAQGNPYAAQPAAAANAGDPLSKYGPKEEDEEEDYVDEDAAKKMKIVLIVAFVVVVLGVAAFFLLSNA